MTRPNKALAQLGDTVVDDRYKGVPLGVSLRLDEFGQRGWNVARGDLSLPVLTLHEAALENNLTAMMTYCTRHGALLAPHGKTTMSPQLFQRQMDAGAWAVSVATPTQVAVARRYGFRRILLANEIVDVEALRWIADEMETDASFEFYCLVDSPVTLTAMDAALDGVLVRRALPVLIEVGADGGRGGIRRTAPALDLARRIASSRHLELAGIELYEGLVSNDATWADLEEVDALCAFARDVVTSVGDERLFRAREIVVSAGGSAYFDRVVERLGAWNGLDLDVQLVLRSGCYLTHDRGDYQRASPLDGRRSLDETLQLRNALAVWTSVLSQPEPGVAILGAGKRDLSFDAGLPTPQLRYARGNTTPTEVHERAKVVRVMDQHSFVHFTSDVTFDPGDVVSLGVSHPCTAMDKYRLIPIIDDDNTVVDAIVTFF